MGGKPSLPGAACSALGGSGGAPRVVLLGRGSSFPLPPARRETQLLLYDSNRAVWSEGARVAPERPRAGRWVEGGHHAIGQATRGRSRGQRAALEGRAQTCRTWTWTYR